MGRTSRTRRLLGTASGNSFGGFETFLTSSAKKEARCSCWDRRRKREKDVSFEVCWEDRRKKSLTCDEDFNATLFSFEYPNQALTSLGRLSRFPSTTARSMTGSEGARLSRRALTVERAISVIVFAHCEREGM